MKKKIILWSMLMTTCIATAFGQVGIGTDAPHPTAMLEVTSTEKGFLPPRMTTVQRDTIEDPAQGLVIYNTDQNCLQFWNLTEWIGICNNPFDPQDPISGFTLDCSSANRTPHVKNPDNSTYWLEKNVNTSTRPVTVKVPYNAIGGAIGITYPTLQVSSTGAGTNLTANLTSGTISASGDLTFLINQGTPTNGGEYIFTFTFAGQNCSFTLATCGAYIAPGEWKDFLCHNLGADYTHDPYDFTQSDAWSLNGANIQWGKRGPNITGDSRIDWQTAPNDGPNGFLAAPTATDPNYGEISDLDLAEPLYTTNPWNSGTELAPVKTANDPCPLGYRIPTQTEWIGVINNNIRLNSGTWATAYPGDPLNYQAAVGFGSSEISQSLKIPIAGDNSRVGKPRGISSRGFTTLMANASAITISPNPLPRPVGFTIYENSFFANPTSGMLRQIVFPVRCIEE